MKTFIAIFVILHGLVHLLYFGQSLRFFELRPGMTWPASSWFFGSIFRGSLTKRIVAGICGLSALLLVLSGTGMLFSYPFLGGLIIAGIIISSLLFILSWNGKWTRLDDQGAFALLINAGLLLIYLTDYLP